ncbi:MAG TPA: ABC transporter permease [Candidatus Omnitrophota bacterium]|nr:ABC transporter permease [Candidatus Omnitrophota bacterium]HPS20420.1 ABC transporter permease [Candidatus Omnitrophota bacterium]
MIVNKVINKASGYGRSTVNRFFSYIGGVSILLSQTLFWSMVPPYRKWNILEQMGKIGVASFPIVFLISFFTGVVLALQSAYQMQRFSAEMYIASLVALSMTRELGPVLTALIIAGRCGAAITAEIGTMKVTEQIDALETLSANPIKYLVVPRLWALLVMLPILTILANFFGIVGGFIIGIWKLDITTAMYMKMTFDPMHVKDVVIGLVKSVSFALVIGMISCFEGFRSEGGAEGVGHATTDSVVRSFIMVIIVDCFITALFYFMAR